jgi:hypothetical protein
MIYLDKNLNEKNLTIIVKYMYSIIFFGQQRKQGLLLVEGRVDRPGWTRTCYVMQQARLKFTLFLPLAPSRVVFYFCFEASIMQLIA